MVKTAEPNTKQPRLPRTGTKINPAKKKEDIQLDDKAPFNIGITKHKADTLSYSSCGEDHGQVPVGHGRVLLDT